MVCRIDGVVYTSCQNSEVGSTKKLDVLACLLLS